jgi:two-component system, OmpR family, response regulator ResD
MSKKKILVVDDEQLIRKLVGDFLKKQGYLIIEADTGKKALDIFEEQKDIDLILLDIMLPECDGWTVCKGIRKTSSVPIIMLTARSEEFDQLFGFEIGADEYIVKPFSPNILVAKVNAMLRRLSPVTNKIKTYDTLKIDDSAHIVTLEDKSIELSPKEYELLLFLVDNYGLVLSREQILDKVWGYDYFGDLRTVDTHINRLRIKLENKSNLIQTVRGFGYKFEVIK